MPRYIDADALVAEIKKDDTYQNWLFRKMIEKQPVVSPDDVRGVVKVNYEHGDYSCSACGHPARRLSFARKKYCDECGAKLLWEVSEDA